MLGFFRKNVIRRAQKSHSFWGHCQVRLLPKT